MTIRTLEPQLVAAVLAGAWIGLGLAQLWIADGRVEQLLIGVAALLTAAFSLATALRASLARQTTVERATALMAVLLLVPFAALLADPLTSEQRAWLRPSPAIAYAGLAAMAATALYGGLRLGGPRRAAVAVAAVAVIAGAIALPALVGGALPTASGGCSPPTLPETARLSVHARAEIDGRRLAGAVLEGERSGGDETWRGRLEGELGTPFQREIVRIGGRAWWRQDDGPWRRLPASDDVGGGATADARLIAVLERGEQAGVEDLGVELVDGRPARHCRLAVDGTAAAEAFLPLAWLAGGRSADDGPQLATWRGELDWWLDREGHLLRAEVIIGGHARDAWTTSGTRGILSATMSLSETTSAPPIRQPVP